MRRLHWTAAIGLLVLFGWARADDQPAAPSPEQAAGEALTTFWTSFIRGDAEAFRQVIDFPLVLQEQPPDAGQANRFVFGPGDWNELRREFPASPLPPEKAPVELANMRLEWLGKVTCLATLDLQATRGETTVQGRYTAILVMTEDGWKVGVATIPM